MTDADTAGLAAAHLWDTSSSWSSASAGVVDTGGVLLYEVVEEPEEPPAVYPHDQPPWPEGVSLREQMAADPLFRQLVAQGLADLEAKRFGPL